MQNSAITYNENSGYILYITYENVFPHKTENINQKKQIQKQVRQ